MAKRTGAGARAQTRRATRSSRPAPIEPAHPRLAGAASYRPRQPVVHAPHRDSNYGVLLLHGLGATRPDGSTGMHVYGGTVPRVVVADRRVRNRAARRARRITRRCAA